MADRLSTERGAFWWGPRARRLFEALIRLTTDTASIRGSYPVNHRHGVYSKLLSG